MENSKEVAIQFVKDGGKCYKQFGFTYRGARKTPITNEEALKKLENERGWSFGMGYYELRWTKDDDGDALVFIEYSESDMW